MSPPLKDPLFWFFTSTHLVLALIGKLVFNVHIDAHPVYNNWDSVWQVLPVDFLQQNLLHNVFSLHSQPPIFNVLCGLFVKIFGDQHMDAFQHFNMILSGLMCGMAWTFLSHYLGRGLWVKLLVALLCTHPSLQLFSAFPTYDLLTAFLCLLSVWCLVCYQREKTDKWLLYFIVTLNILLLTRSAFHLLLLLPALCALALLPPKNQKLLIPALLLCLSSFGWYAKNFGEYGFFGASSWFGLNLFRAASTYYEVFPDHNMAEMAKLQAIDPLVLKLPKFTLPFEYRKFGFVEESKHPTLSRNNFHNINLVAISQLYERNALALISAHPLGYLRAVLLGYSRFWVPSFEYPDVQWNRDGVRTFIRLHSFIQGTFLDFLHVGPYRLTSIFALLYPFALLLFALQLPFNRKHAVGKELMQEQLPLIWCSLLSLYSVIVFNLFEYGENQRFKFSVEFLILAFVVIVFAKTRKQLLSPFHRS